MEKLPIQSYKDITVNGVTFTMVRVEHGEFTMGNILGMCPVGIIEPPHQVNISNDFYIGETPVTQQQWKAIMDCNPSVGGSDPQCPVDSVTGNDCQIFIKQLNQLTGLSFRLPSEEEWEYAAIGATNAARLNDDYTRPVKQLEVNPIGLYDLGDNVREWTATEQGGKRVIRGGCIAHSCRFVCKTLVHRIESDSLFGFRLAL